MLVRRICSDFSVVFKDNGKERMGEGIAFRFQSVCPCVFRTRQLL